jgi:hypothetical protein
MNNFQKEQEKEKIMIELYACQEQEKETNDIEEIQRLWNKSNRLQFLLTNYYN